jgi:hypothetical protein
MTTDTASLFKIAFRPLCPNCHVEMVPVLPWQTDQPYGCHAKCSVKYRPSEGYTDLTVSEKGQTSREANSPGMVGHRINHKLYIAAYDAQADVRTWKCSREGCSRELKAEGPIKSSPLQR